MPRSHIPFHQTKNCYFRGLQFAPWSGGGFQSSPFSQVPGGFFDCLDDVSFALPLGSGGPQSGEALGHMAGTVPGSEVLCSEGFLGNFLQVLVNIFRAHFAKFTGFRLILPQRKVAAAIADSHGPSVRLHFRGEKNQEHDITLRDREATNPSALSRIFGGAVPKRQGQIQERFPGPAESPETDSLQCGLAAYPWAEAREIGFEATSLLRSTFSAHDGSRTRGSRRVFPYGPLLPRGVTHLTFARFRLVVSCQMPREHFQRYVSPA